MIVGLAVRKVTRLGQPVLRQPTRTLAPDEITGADVRRLVAEMAAAMEEYDGVGIAANQVGEGLSLFLMGLARDNPRHPEGIELTAVFNPSIRPLDDEKETDWEGCLSVPGLRGQVERHVRLELQGLDDKGRPFTRRYEGFPARVVQHEVDHLLGKVYLDRMKDLSTLAFLSRV